MAMGRALIFSMLLVQTGAVALTRGDGSKNLEQDKPQHPQKFVVITHARSGHKWLRDILNSRPGILAAGEELQGWSAMEKCATAKQGKSTWETDPTMKELIQSFTEFFSGSHPTFKHLNGKLAECYPEPGNGLPIPHWNDGNESKLYGLTWLPDAQGAAQDARLEEMGKWFINNNIKVILLTRKNFLGHYVSQLARGHQKAPTSYVRHNASQHAPHAMVAKEEDQLTVDVSHMQDAAIQFQQLHDRYIKFKTEMNMEAHHVFEVSYEELVNNTRGAAENLQKFLWLEPKSMHAEYRRLHPRQPRAYITNWAEVKDAAKKALLPKYLDA